MSSPYKIDWSADLGPALEMLGATFQKRHENDRAEENTAIQRMYADAQLRKISDQEVRDRAEEERKRKKEQADALQYIADNLPGNPGLSQAHGDIYGIPVTIKPDGTSATAPAASGNPLFNAVMGPQDAPFDKPGPGIGSALQQLRPTGATGEPTQATADLMPPQEDLSLPLEGPQQAVETSRGRVLIGTGTQLTPEMIDYIQRGFLPGGTARDNDFGIAASRLENNLMPGQDAGRAVGDAMLRARVSSDPAVVQRDLDKQNRLSGADQRDIERGQLYHPNENDVNPLVAPDGDLSVDQLMALAAPPQAPPQGSVTPAAQAQGATSHPLYQAVLGGKSYDLTSEAPTTGLGPKYDDYLKHLMLMPGKKSREQAMAKVYELYQKDQHEGRVDTRTFALADQRENQYNTHHLDVDQIQARDRASNETRIKVAQILAAAKRDSSGNIVLTPEQHARLTAIVERYDQGGSIPEITAMAQGGPGEKPLPQKAYLPTIGAQERAAAAGERAGQRREGLEATGPGIPPGSVWKNPQVATKGTQTVQRFHRVEERMQMLIDHVEKYGERIDANSQQYKDRLRLAEGAIAALRPYNELSNTIAGMQSERAILGPTGAFGHGWVLGANLSGLQDMLREARGQHQVNLQTMLRPDGGSKLSPILGGPRKGTAAEPTEEDKDAAFARKILGK